MSFKGIGCIDYGKRKRISKEGHQYKPLFKFGIPTLLISIINIYSFYLNEGVRNNNINKFLTISTILTKSQTKF